MGENVDVGAGLTLGLDPRGWKKGLDEAEREALQFTNVIQTLGKRIRGDVEDAHDSLHKKKGVWGTLTVGVESFGRGVLDVSKKVLSLTTAVGGLAGTGLAAFLSKSASDFEETKSKFDVVFGEVASVNEAFVNNLGSTVGRSKVELTSAMAAFQDTFVPLGFARKEAAGMSQTLTKLAIDIASFDNKSEGETMADLQSAIIGNHETMRKYGVIITETTLNQELLNMGIQGGTKSATEQEKVLARLNIIMNGTADAQGNAIREAESFAGVMRALRGAVMDTAAEVGVGLNVAILSAIKEAGGVNTIKVLFERVGLAVVEVGKFILRMGAQATKWAYDFITNLGDVNNWILRVQKGIKYVELAIIILGNAGRIVWEGMNFLIRQTWLGVQALWAGLKLVVSVLATGFAVVLEKIVRGVGAFVGGLNQALDFLGLGNQAMSDFGRSANDLADDLGVMSESFAGDAVESFEQMTLAGNEFVDGFGRNFDETLGSLDWSGMWDDMQTTGEEINLMDQEIEDSARIFQESLGFARKEAQGLSDDISGVTLATRDAAGAFTEFANGVDLYDSGIRESLGLAPLGGSSTGGSSRARGGVGSGQGSGVYASPGGSAYGSPYGTNPGENTYGSGLFAHERANPGLYHRGYNHAGRAGLNGPGYAEGGIAWGPGGRDAISARLTAGEAIINPDSTQENVALVRMLNDRSASSRRALAWVNQSLGYGGGRSASQALGGMRTGASSRSSQINVNIPVTVQAVPRGMSDLELEQKLIRVTSRAARYGVAIGHAAGGA